MWFPAEIFEKEYVASIDEISTVKRLLNEVVIRQENSSIPRAQSKLKKKTGPYRSTTHVHTFTKIDRFETV